jgi:hypothetical protein
VEIDRRSMEATTTSRAVRYVGRRTKEGVTVTREREDGTNESLPLRLDLWNHSPSGFEWGYNGSGAAQLALAIASDAVGNEWARHHGNYQAFKFARVGTLPEMGWILTRDEVRDWFEREAEPLPAEDKTE